MALLALPVGSSAIPALDVKTAAPFTLSTTFPTDDVLPSDLGLDLSSLASRLGPAFDDPCASRALFLRAYFCTPPIAGDLEVPSSDHPEPEAVPESNSVSPLAATWRVETNQGFLLSRAAELDGAAGPEFVHVSMDGFVVATDAAQHDLWRWTPRAFAAAFGYEPDALRAHTFVGLSLGAFSLATDHPFALADATGDGRDDVLVSLALFPDLQTPVEERLPAHAGLALIDGATGSLLWSDVAAGLVRHVLLRDVNDDDRPDIVYGVENGLAQPYLYGSPIGNATEPPSRVVALDGRTREPLWTYDAGGPWSFLAVLESTPDSGWALYAMPGGLDARQPSNAGPYVTVLDASTGVPRWQQGVADPNVIGLAVQPDRVRLLTIQLSESLTGEAIPDSSTLNSYDLSTGKPGDAIVLSDVLAWDLEPDVNDQLAVAGLQLNAARTAYEFGFVELRDAQDQPVWRYEASTGPRLDAEPGPRLVRTDLPILLHFTAARDGHGEPALAIVEHHWATQNTALLVFEGSAVPLRYPGAYEVAGVTPDPQDGFVAATVSGHLDRVRRGAAFPLGTPLSGSLFGLARLDVDGDGTRDAVVVGQAGVAFAVRPDATAPLWAARCGATRAASPAYDLRATPYGQRDTFLVVASWESMCRLDPATGTLLWSYTRPADHVHERYVRVEVADLNRDGTPDLVVPGSRLFALDGRTGTELWSFGAPMEGVLDALVTPPVMNERMMADHAYGFPALGDVNRDGVPDAAFQFVLDYPRQRAQLAVVDGASGLPLWIQEIQAPFLIPSFWDSTLLLDLQGDGTLEFVSVWMQNEDAGTERGLSLHQTTILGAYDAATGLPLWTVRFPMALYLNGLRAVPLAGGGHGVLLLDLLHGWALVSPEGALSWLHYAHHEDGSRGVQPWDARSLDSNGDGTLDVVVADSKDAVLVFDGKGFAQERLTGLARFAGPSAVRFQIASDPREPEPLAFVAFPYAAWVYKHGEAGVGIMGSAATPYGAGGLGAPAVALAGDAPLATAPTSPSGWVWALLAIPALALLVWRHPPLRRN